jgi:hypothetical protein
MLNAPRASTPPMAVDNNVDFIELLLQIGCWKRPTGDVQGTGGFHLPSRPGELDAIAVPEAQSA